jgi:hypothetical protein
LGPQPAFARRLNRYRQAAKKKNNGHKMKTSFMGRLEAIAGSALNHHCLDLRIGEAVEHGIAKP